MPERVRFGILGGARIAKSQLVPAILASPYASFAAFASQTTPSYNEWTSLYPEAKAFDRYEDLIESSLVDAIYIPLPNSLHAKWTVAALEAGKHVLCEKPMFITVEEGRKVIETQHKAGKIAAEAFMYRYHPQYKWLMDLISRGELGEIKHISAEFGYTLENLADIRMQKDLGGGSLWDVGCYTVDIARTILGKPLRAKAFAMYGGTGVDISMAMMLEYKRATALLRCGFDLCPTQGVRVVGTKGYAGLSMPFRPDLGAPKRVFNGSVEAVEPFNMYRAEVDAFCTAIIDGATNALMTLSDSLEQVTILTGIHTAARENTSVTFD
jgi:xylose dehydrogenase (NAD/NADP)